MANDHPAGVLTEVPRQAEDLAVERNERVPAGRKFRDGQVLFTPGEVQAIRDYANQVEPIGGTSPEQLKLFTRNR